MFSGFSSGSLLATVKIAVSDFGRRRVGQIHRLHLARREVKLVGFALKAGQVDAQIGDGQGPRALVADHQGAVPVSPSRTSPNSMRTLLTAMSGLSITVRVTGTSKSKGPSPEAAAIV